MKCPSAETWFLAELGDVTVNTRDAMLAHREDCAACRETHARQQRLLGDLTEAPSLASSEDEFVAKVMARCAVDAARPERATPTATLRRFVPWTSGLLAAAALLVFVSLRGAEPLEQFQARGGRPGATASAASADVFVAHGKTLQRLSGSTLSAGDRLAVRVVNPSDRDAYFMVFAIDAAGDVHWLFPAYLDAGTSPEAPQLSAAQAAHVLPETVELVDVAAGKLRVVSMVSERRMNVKEVEARLASLPNTALSQVFPESTLREWSSAWRRH